MAMPDAIALGALEPIAVNGTKCLMLTTIGADRGRLVSVDLTDCASNWSVVLPETDLPIREAVHQVPMPPHLRHCHPDRRWTGGTDAAAPDVLRCSMTVPSDNGTGVPVSILRSAVPPNGNHRGIVLHTFGWLSVQTAPHHNPFAHFWVESGGISAMARDPHLFAGPSQKYRRPTCWPCATPGPKRRL